MKRVTAICALTVWGILVALPIILTPEHLNMILTEYGEGYLVGNLMGELLLIFLGCWIIEKIVLYIQTKARRKNAEL